MVGIVFRVGNKGEQTRERILDVSQRLILQKGFSGTAIDEIVYEADITKGGFFYHFKNRNDLARSLMQRYLDEDERILKELIDRASALVDDPLQRVLAFLKLYAELLADMEEAHPGCLVASYTYESLQFDADVRDMTRDGIEGWKAMFVELFEPVLQTHSCEVELGDLADMLNALLEGGILLSRLQGNNRVLGQQVLMFRDYVRRVFTPLAPV